MCIRDSAEVDQIVTEVLEILEETPVVRAGLGRAVDRLSELISERRPDLAFDLDTLGESVWRKLGRTATQR